MEFKVGDKVSERNESGYSTIIEIISDLLVVIEDEHGFDKTIPINELSKLVSNDFGQIPDISKDHELLAEITQKEKKHQPKKSVKEKAMANWGGFPYIDLHIEELVEDHLRLPVQEILQIQMSRFRSFILKCEQMNEKKAYIIHGVGEGVLRSEVHIYLHRKANVAYDFASSLDFGENGATEVNFIY